MRHYPHPLAGRLFWTCGDRIRAEAKTKRQGWTFRRYRHARRCPAWGQDTRIAGVFEGPISAQIEQLRLGDDLLADLQRLAGGRQPSPGRSPVRRQLERDLEEGTFLHGAVRSTDKALSTDEAP